MEIIILQSVMTAANLICVAWMYEKRTTKQQYLMDFQQVCVLWDYFMPYNYWLSIKPKQRR